MQDPAIPHIGATVSGHTPDAQPTLLDKQHPIITIKKIFM